MAEYSPLSWFVHRAGNAAAKRELLNCACAVPCVSLRAGAAVMPDIEVLCPCSEPLAHTSGATFSELCQVGAVLPGARGVPIFRKWAGMGRAHEGLTWDQRGSGRCLGVSEHPWAPALTLP